MLVFPSRRVVNELFRTTANVQLRKFRLKEGLKLSNISLTMISFIYSRLCEASLWLITLTVFSNTPKLVQP